MAKELTLEQYKAFYEKMKESHYAKAYITLSKKMDELCGEFDKVTIDITDEESALYKNFLAFSKQALDILEDMDEMMTKMDKTKAAEIKEKQRQTGALSVESMVRQKKNG